jgi:hypothetical protein
MFIEKLKLKMGEASTNLLVEYFKPGTAMAEGEIGLTELVIAGLLNKMGKPVTVENVDKVAAKASDLVKKHVDLIEADIEFAKELKELLD